MRTVTPRNRFTKAMVSVVVTIFLGAIGSGIWALFLGPATEVLSRNSIRLISSVFHGYLDYVYEQVSRNPEDQFAKLPYVLIVVGVVTVPWLAIFELRSSLTGMQERVESLTDESDGTVTKEHLEERVRRLQGRVKRLRRIITSACIPLALLSTAMYSEEAFSTSHSRRAALFLDRSIEIVSPYLDERDRLELRARFRSIESAKEFYDLEGQLRAIAGQHSTKLPQFESIR
jgi:hypothetical protein